MTDVRERFRFQPFKKCFNSKCTTIFVPGDFKPSSPRRMFCSSDCFAEHWREQLAFVFSKDLVDRDHAHQEHRGFSNSLKKDESMRRQTIPNEATTAGATELGRNGRRSYSETITV